eukprot:m.355913 g.355913  ORF g.355913 m.355913 type:complete len:166 (+) comp17386_c0_seq1:900-1397(+)
MQRITRVVTLVEMFLPSTSLLKVLGTTFGSHLRGDLIGLFLSSARRSPKTIRLPPQSCLCWRPLTEPEPEPWQSRAIDNDIAGPNRCARKATETRLLVTPTEATAALNEKDKAIVVCFCVLLLLLFLLLSLFFPLDSLTPISPKSVAQPCVVNCKCLASETLGWL